MTILVSACLLGLACRYDGESRPSPRILTLASRHTLIPICPEQAGGLPTPRIPSEYDGARVINRAGADVTAAFRRGAAEAVHLAKVFQPSLAILKDKSPSCGIGLRYSGNFDGTLTEGDGVTAEALSAHGIPLLCSAALEAMTEAEFEDFIQNPLIK